MKGMLNVKKIGLFGSEMVAGLAKSTKALPSSTEVRDRAIEAIMEAGRETPAEAGRSMEEVLPHFFGELTKANKLPTQTDRTEAIGALLQFLTEDASTRSALVSLPFSTMWNTMARGERVSNLGLLKHQVKKEADEAFSKNDTVLHDLLWGLYDIYKEPPTPFSAPLQSHAALTREQMVSDIQRVLNAEQNVAAAAQAVARPGIFEDPFVPDRGMPSMLRTPEGETPAMNVDTGEVRSVFVIPTAPLSAEELYANSRKNYHQVAEAASSSSSDATAGRFPPEPSQTADDSWNFFHAMADRQKYLESSSSSRRNDRLKRVEVEEPDTHGHIITTSKRILVPASHRDEEERFRNAQRAAAMEQSSEAQVLERKKATFQRRRATFYG
jgi:hypothetical protein